MRVDHPRNILATLGVVHASTTAACSIHAWVRAPDLAPGAIVQGDARMTLAPACTAAESASLGLRFKERAFVKASRSIEATKRPTGQRKWIDMFDPESASPSSPWVLPEHAAFNCSDDIAYGEIVKNKNLWFVREEERIVFESTQAIDMGETQPGLARDVVQDFALLVPSTNFPPALDYPHAMAVRRDEEFVDVETMYEYFVRVTFANGTTAETSAGFTAFHPLYDSPSENLVRSKTVQLQILEPFNGNLVDSDPIVNYTAQITSKHDGFAFSQGADDHVIQVAITRTGRARTFDEPLHVQLCLDATLLPKWAPKYALDPSLQSLQRPSHILRATSADFKSTTPKSTARCTYFGEAHMPPKDIIMPNATADQIALGEVVCTTSSLVHFRIDPDPRHATDFETYYHMQRSALFLMLDIPRTADDPVGPVDIDMFERRAARKRVPDVEPDEEAWVPWYSVPEVARWRGEWTYTGNLSVSVHPAPSALLPKACARARAHSQDGVVGSEEQVVMATDEHTGCTMTSPTHYLAEGARAPTFIDSRTTHVHALLAKTPAERDLLAPLLAPVVSSPPPSGEERVHRYYRVPRGERPLIYVGETWVKKVAHRDEYAVTVPRPDAMPIVLANLRQAMKHMDDEL